MNLTPEEHITAWDLGPVLNPIVGHDWWEWWAERDWLWAQAPAVPGAIGGIRTLRRAGHYLEIITSKPEWAEPQTWRWLGKWRPPVHRVTIVPFSKERPIRKCDVTNAVLLVDDKPETCVEWVESRLDRTAFLYNRPHNRAGFTSRSERIVRVNNWVQVLKEVDRIERKGL